MTNIVRIGGDEAAFSSDFGTYGDLFDAAAPMRAGEALGAPPDQPLVLDLDRTLVRTAQAFGASDGELFRKVVLPASLPLVMAGMRLAIGRALIGVAVGELFAGTAGLGWSISYYGGLLKTTDMLASVIVVGLIGVLLSVLASALEHRLDSWRVDVS